MTGAYVDLVFGADAGVAVVAYAHGPHWTDAGRYSHAGAPVPVYYQWPDERARLLDDAARAVLADPVDVYVCPALRRERSRRRGGAIGPRVLWADLDGPPADPVLFAALDPVRVASGRDGHEHVYVALDGPVPVEAHRRMNRTLSARLGADAKWSDESLLRLPGTFNHKTDPPSPVVIL